jgi:hypothetical protein
MKLNLEQALVAMYGGKVLTCYDGAEYIFKITGGALKIKHKYQESTWIDCGYTFNELLGATFIIHNEPKPKKTIEVYDWRLWCVKYWIITGKLLTKEQAKEYFKSDKHEIHAGPFVVEDLSNE